MRIGHGYDVHALGAGDHVRLGGVSIGCDGGLRAHSDGDVVVHALCDALLGAAALGDIGHLFPDDAAQWRDADSRFLLADVVARVAYAGWRPGNTDITVIAAKPRLSPHVGAMKANIAQDLAVTGDAVNVKATTHEGLDALGRGQGIAAHAVVLLEPV
ncbi:MAG: 2-C-methyl-D-erythritol 2,4-cyclodiphosphate synthase [Proteobacteria bacterium SW_6_67_9]|jgi:2-C-methyl-D-erythritol 2,4-cyclodiphosphate synthase|nr:MAG: 2-C-methyl-D-erythritol 2,4-cyclodiphosphate synthase [Proteobacteria bacterium SW_6_67_9]